MGTLDPYLLNNCHFKNETCVRCLLLWLVQHDRSLYTTSYSYRGLVVLHCKLSVSFEVVIA